MKYFPVIAIALLVVAIVVPASATNAEATAKQVEKFYDKSTPYNVVITPEEMIEWGFNTSELVHNTTFEITVNSANYNALEETVVMNINVRRGVNNIKINNPVHFYMPFDGGIHRSSAKKQLDNFNLMLVSLFDYFPVGVY